MIQKEDEGGHELLAVKTESNVNVKMEGMRGIREWPFSSFLN